MTEGNPSILSHVSIGTNDFDPDGDALTWTLAASVPVDETPIAEGYCAPKRCAGDEDCGPDGACSDDYCGPP